MKNAVYSARMPYHWHIAARWLIAATLVVAGVVGPLPGCSTMGLNQDISVASAVARIARADSERVRSARNKCADLERRASYAEDAEQVAALLRMLSIAQRELADAIEADRYLDSRVTR